MSSGPSPSQPVPLPGKRAAGQRVIDRRTRALARIIMGRRTVTDAEIQEWLEERMAFSRQSAEIRRQALEAAQSIIDQGLACVSRIARLRLTRQALRLCPECARGYIILAQEAAQNALQAHDLYRIGMRAAERSLGHQAMRRWAGRFGEIDETRDYVDARLGLANTLWTMDRQHEAIPHYRELLALDPVDYVGVRFILLFYSIIMNDATLTEELLARYADENFAEWLYSSALYRFRREGNSRAAQKALHEAIAANQRIAEYLTHRETPPQEDLPAMAMEQGSDGEAIAYMVDNDILWEMTPGSRRWLERALDQLASA